MLSTMISYLFLVAVGEAKSERLNVVLTLSESQELVLPAPELQYLSSKYHKNLICQKQDFQISDDFERVVECTLHDGKAGHIFMKQLNDPADGAPLVDIQFLNPEVRERNIKRRQLAWGELIEWAESNNGGATFYYLRPKMDEHWYVLRLSNSLLVTPQAIQIKRASYTELKDLDYGAKITGQD